MKKVLLLKTDWKENYWGYDKEAEYPSMKYTNLIEWNELFETCPLPGLGIYIKHRKNDFSNVPFVYLKITGMNYDVSTEKPFFNFKVIGKSNTESIKIFSILPAENNGLFSAIVSEKLIEILNEINESPPKEWLDLMGHTTPVSNWEDRIGKYFLEIKNGSLGDKEFEERVAKLLIALGFKVTQKGYIIKGAYPDGIAAFNNEYAIVYDCKNSSGYAPSADDIRAIKTYLDDEKKVGRYKHLFCAFIAKSFRPIHDKDIFYFSIDSLLYLLYKRLNLGIEFDLNPFKKILSNNAAFDIETINKEWII